MSTTIESPDTLTYGRGDNVYKLDLTKANDAVKIRLMSRGLTHVLGSEVASKVISAIERHEKENGPLAADEREQMKDDLTDEYRSNFIEEMHDGTFAVSGRGPSGPRLSTLESEVQKLVGERVRSIMAGMVKAKSATWDKDSKTWTLADGSTRTLQECIDNFVQSDSPKNVAAMAEFRAEAEKEVARKAARAELTKADEEFAI